LVANFFLRKRLTDRAKEDHKKRKEEHKRRKADVKERIHPEEFLRLFVFFFALFVAEWIFSLIALLL
jgi:hypothetical protein